MLVFLIYSKSNNESVLHVDESIRQRLPLLDGYGTVTAVLGISMFM